jgi:putative endonuclease
MALDGWSDTGPLPGRQARLAAAGAPVPPAAAARRHPARAHAGRTAWRAGLAAEDAAERLYAAEGGRVAARRWRCPHGEIDLVIEHGPLVVFVEVKARRSAALAAAALRPRQAERLLAAAACYLATASGAGEARIDVVTVDGFGRAERIENAVGQH